MFKKSVPKTTNTTPEQFWKVLIVDDEPEVHTITKVALSEFEFDHKGLTLLSAYSGAEARTMIEAHPDIALIYLDVVMESDDAGLLFVKHLREELQNKFVRVVLRTGQPGQAPERKVIVDYDINDYKEKTDFDSTKLFTTTLSGLRAYRDIMEVEAARKSLDRYRLGLEEVISASANLFEIRSLQKFARGLLDQIACILHLEQDTLLVRSKRWTVEESHRGFEVMAGTGNLSNTSATLPEDVSAILTKASQSHSSIFEDGQFVGYFPTKSGKVNLIYLDGVDALDELDRRMVQVFSSNVTIAFDNLYLDREVFDTQVEIIDTLGDVVENRSKEAAYHVKRVSHLSRLLGRLAGLNESEVDILFMSAPMHDIGKVAIPDSILLKPGKLDAEEWEIMKTHAEIGQNIFSKSHRPVLQAAAIVAGQHHERFDGSGYPKATKGEDIHIYGRIVAIVDVFDALIHKRCYKEAWTLDDVINELKLQEGKHFDPRLLNLFLDNLKSVMAIVEAYPD
jgi:response regulator RpfG family c-di-GMP phosphodiesterase